MSESLTQEALRLSEARREVAKAWIATVEDATGRTQSPSYEETAALARAFLFEDRQVVELRQWESHALESDAEVERLARRVEELEAALKRLTDYAEWVFDGGMALEGDEAIRDALQALRQEVDRRSRVEATERIGRVFAMTAQRIEDAKGPPSWPLRLQVERRAERPCAATRPDQGQRYGRAEGEV